MCATDDQQGHMHSVNGQERERKRAITGMDGKEMERYEAAEKKMDINRRENKKLKRNE